MIAMRFQNKISLQNMARPFLRGLSGSRCRWAGSRDAAAEPGSPCEARKPSCSKARLPRLPSRGRRGRRAPHPGAASVARGPSFAVSWAVWVRGPKRGPIKPSRLSRGALPCLCSPCAREASPGLLGCPGQVNLFPSCKLYREQLRNAKNPKTGANGSRKKQAGDEREECMIWK